MKLDIKDYKLTKIKKYFKMNRLFFFVNGMNQNSLDWLSVEQGLKKASFDYYKISNKTTIKALDGLIYRNAKPLISGSTFLIQPKTNKNFLKQIIFNTLNPLSFELLIIKLNNKTYSVTSLKTIDSLNYKEIKLLFYQFNLTYLKTCFAVSK